MSALDGVHVPLGDTIAAPPVQADHLEGMKAIAPPPGAAQSITQDAGDEFPGYSGPDFQPSREQREVLKTRRSDHLNKLREGRMDNKAVYTEAAIGEDYLSPEETYRRKRNTQSRVSKLAKEIFDAKQTKLDRYNKAKKFLSRIDKMILAGALESQDPTEKERKIQRAHKIVKAGPPITRDEANEQARHQIMNRLSF